MIRKWRVRPKSEASGGGLSVDSNSNFNASSGAGRKAAGGGAKKEQLKTRARRLEYKLKHKYITFDNVVLLAAVGVCLLWTWGAISSMTRNWELARTVAMRQRERAVLELEVATLEMENEYYQSDEYLELAARARENKKLAGETMVYLPENSDEAKHKHDDTATTEVEAAKTEDESNLQQWTKFLFGA